MSYKKPEDMTLDEIREQLAIYNRLYYNLRKDDKAYMQKNGDAGLRHAQKKRIKEYVQTYNINQEDLAEKQITEIMNDKNHQAENVLEQSNMIWRIVKSLCL